MAEVDIAQHRAQLEGLGAAVADWEDGTGRPTDLSPARQIDLSGLRSAAVRALASLRGAEQLIAQCRARSLDVRDLGCTAALLVGPPYNGPAAAASGSPRRFQRTTTA